MTQAKFVFLLRVRVGREENSDSDRRIKFLNVKN